MTVAKPGPRSAQVNDILQRRIVAETYAVRGILPTELDLCQEFAISRHTVREALHRLADAGNVQWQQVSGRQVISANAKCGCVHSMWLFKELFQYASDTRLRMDRVSQAVPALSLGTVPGDAAGQE